MPDPEHPSRLLDQVVRTSRRVAVPEPEPLHRWHLLTDVMDPGEPAVPNDGGHDPQCTNAHPSVRFATGHGPDRREVTTSACILGTADLFTTSTD